MTMKASPSDVSPDVLYSPEALRRAWQQVRRNGPSPGTDQLTLTQFERKLDSELTRLRQEMVQGAYAPQPVRRFYVLKPSGKKRSLTIWTVRDRVAQRVVVDYLTPKLESLFLECSYGFRPGRRIEDAVAAVMQAHAANRRWVIDGDIADCFDSIPADLLLTQVRTLIQSAFIVQLVARWLNTPVEGRRGECAGVSQGGVISPLLTNLYLHRFDQAITMMLPEANLVRFADDFMILCRRKAEAAWGLKVTRHTLASLRMDLNQGKTRIIHFDQGFTFLGVEFKAGWHGPLPTQNSTNKE